MSDVSGKIRTVRGDIAPEELGITMAHEHLVIDLYRMTGSYSSIIDEVDLVIEELQQFKDAGGSAVVDLTNIGIGRNPKALAQISEATGVHVVMGSGWYRERFYPPYITEKKVNELADMIVRDIEEGVDGTGIRAGIIGEIGTERHFITPAQERVFRAAARAQRRTGAPLNTHTTHYGELALDQLELLEDEGVNLSRVIVSHLGERRGIGDILPIAERGAWVEIDNIGYEDYQRDEVRAQNIKLLIEAGYLDRILLSLDICCTEHLAWYGGKGFAHLLRRFVPLLKETGVTQEQIETMLIHNPRRALAFR